MTDRLADKICVVTGAGTRGDGVGNGRAAAILFAREGARVVAVDRDSVAAEATAEMIAAEGGEAEAFVADLTDLDAAEAVIAHTLECFGPPDVLHNNIGIAGEFGNVVDTDDESWDRVMATNVRSVVLASRFAIPEMRAAGRGSIVNVSSVSALRPRGRVAYSTSKGAVIALTRAMAVEHGPEGIRVNCIVPGPVYTPFVAEGGMTDEMRERRRMASLLKREGTAWDVAHAAVFLASDEASYITGAILPVDGGVTLASPER